MGVRVHHLEERLSRRMEADFDLMRSFVSYLYLAADFGVEELKQVRLLVTPESVSEKEFLEAWAGRFEATRESVAAAIRGRCEKRRKRLGAADDGQDGGRDSDGEDD
ncbi:MAG TPA: hypothetical protein VF668_24600 [Pyrinomonadaceae bacterium]|jgi:hypothetical protein